MHAAIARLLSITGEAIATEPLVEESLGRLEEWGAPGSELRELLKQRNGFYAFERALVVRPCQHSGAPLGVLDWNANDLWKRDYIEDLRHVLFFAEDVFGGQFCIRDGNICTFDPETALFEIVSNSLGGWADDLLADRDFRTGYPLAHAWQLENGPLGAGVRLLPKVPFVCGGKYDLDNLHPLNEVKGMLFRSSIANQIRNLPDGSHVTFVLARRDSQDGASGTSSSVREEATPGGAQRPGYATGEAEGQ